MNSVLNGLGVNPADTSQTPAAPDMTAPASAPESPSPGTLPAKPLLLLRAISAGQLSATWVPKGSTPFVDVPINGEVLTSVGVGLYRSKAPNVVGVLYNPKKIDEGTLQKLDSEGKLTEALPPITEFLPESAPPASEDSETPRPATVPVLPRPTMTGDAQRSVATERMQQLAGVEPSKRPIPGGGAVLNGLMSRPV